MRSSLLRSALGALVIVAASSAFAGTNLISNGDFASPSQGGNWNIYFPSVDGWTSLAGRGIEIGTSTIYGLPCVSTGCQHMELNAYTWGVDSYTVTGLTVGQTYVLSYNYGVRNGGGPSSATTTFGGVVLTTDGVTGGNYWTTGWYADSFTIVATSTTENLVLAAAPTGVDSYGDEYTNFSLTAVPEPATWAMMGFGFASLAFAGFRSRRAAVV
jgi:hypothetical protein